MGEFQFAAERRLARLFPRHVFLGIVRGDMDIGRGVPHVVINAVDDPEEAVLSRLQHAFQAIAIFRRLDFLGIGRAHGVQQVGVDHAALEQVDLAVELESAGRKVGGRESGRGILRGREEPLIAHIVNRK